MKPVVLLMVLAALSPVFELPAAETVAIVENGASRAYLALPGDEPKKPADLLLPSRQETARMLADYVKRSTGAELPVGSGEGVRIELVVAQQPGMDMEGFRIDFPDDKTIRLTGGSLRGLQYAAQDFLERYLGVRWLWPGELGTEIPKHDTVAVPRQAVAQNPSMLRRLLTGGRHSKNPEVVPFYEWMVRQRGSFHVRMNASHNLWRLIPVKEYGETHPEFYPIHQGKRMIPKDGYNIYWNPCLTAPGIVEAAAKHISRGKNVICAVGANDGGKFCECENCRKIDGDRKTFEGVPDRSQSYIEFCIKLAKLRPDVTFGGMAYHETIHPPKNVKLPKNLIVGMTVDTMMWSDPAYKAECLKIMRGWQECMEGPMSWHDYIYGSTYTFPRIYSRMLGENVKFLYQNNVRYLEAEYYGHAGQYHDAIKAYVFLRTAWDVNCDVNALIEDWCTAAVGKEAAPYLMQYFDKIEQFWLSPAVRETHWFRKSGKTYLKWADSSYLDAFDPALLGELEALLRKVVELSTNKARAEFFLKTFLEFKPKVQLWKKNQFLAEKAKTYHFDSLVGAMDFNGLKPDRPAGHWQQGTAQCRFYNDPTGGRNNSQAIAINAEGAKNLSVCYLLNFYPAPDKLCKLTYWSRWEGMTPGCTMKFTVAWRSKAKGWLDSSYFLTHDVQADEGPMPWHKTELYFFSPPEKDAIMVFQPGFTKATSGTLWIDDVTLEVMNYSPEELAAFQKLDFGKVVYREDFNRPGAMFRKEGREKEKLFRDETEGRDNGPCIRTDSAAASLIQFIPLKTPGKYKISGFYRGAGAKVTAAFQNERKWMAKEFTMSACYPASSEWKEFVLYVNRPEGNDVRVALMLSAAEAAGPVWFDDITIATTKETKQ